MSRHKSELHIELLSLVSGIQIMSWSLNSLNIKSVLFCRELTFKFTIYILRNTCLKLSGPGFDWTSRHIRIIQGNTTNKYELLFLNSRSLAEMFISLVKYCTRQLWLLLIMVIKINVSLVIRVRNCTGNFMNNDSMNHGTIRGNF